MSSSAFTLSRLTTKEARRAARKKRPLANAAVSNIQGTAKREFPLEETSPAPTQQKKKKRSRKDVVARLTSSAKKRARGATTLPIPSFQPINDLGGSSSRIGELEKAFFDEESDSGEERSKTENVEKRKAAVDVKPAIKARNKASDRRSTSKYCEIIEIVDSDDDDGGGEDDDDSILLSTRNSLHKEHGQASSAANQVVKPLTANKSNATSSTTRKEVDSTTVSEPAVLAIASKTACNEQISVQNVLQTETFEDKGPGAPTCPHALKKLACHSQVTANANNTLDINPQPQMQQEGNVNPPQSHSTSNTCDIDVGENSRTLDQSIPKETEQRNLASWDAVATTNASTQHAQLLSKEPVKTDLEEECCVQVPKPQSKQSRPRKKSKNPPQPAATKGETQTKEASISQPKPKAKRGRPRKAQQVQKKAPPKSGRADSAQVGQFSSATNAVQAQEKPKRRTRKSCCALCKTCPCQKTQTSDVALLDVTSLSRSGIAMEKALIRRLQKLEKSAESLEDQTELVRRKLKAHRRQLWKKSQQNSEGEVSGFVNKTIAPESKPSPDSFFLPDAEAFEQQKTESEALDDEEIRNAQLRLFRKIPLKQATLAEMLGFTMGKDLERGNDSFHAEEKDAESTALNALDDHEFPSSENAATEEIRECDEEDDEQSEYVEETEYVDASSRVIHRNGRNDNTGEAKDSCSIWDSAVTQMTKGRKSTGNRYRNECTDATSKWDAMFAEQEAEDMGLDSLLDLFADDEQPDNHSQSTDAFEVVGAEVSMSMLTQEARVAAKDIIANVDSKSGMLDRACPNWKENVSFAMKQDDPQVIDQALTNVRRSRQRMLQLKLEILDAWERQNAALEVFETALQASAKLSSAKCKNDNHNAGLGGFFSQQADAHDEDDDENKYESPFYG